MSTLRVALFGLGAAAAAFHIWNALLMRVSYPTGLYFAVSGGLFLLGALLVLLGGAGPLFKLGGFGLVALSLIDNALLVYTRTFGAGFVFALMGHPGVPGGGFAGGFTGNVTRTFTRTFSHSFNGTFTRSFNGTFSRAGAGGFRPPGNFALPWSTTWIPPGAVQFFVLQSVIIVVAVATLWMARGSGLVAGTQSPAPGT